MRGRFFGKYRAVVTDVDDPMKLGRLRARVPDVTGDQESGWALPCVPFAGEGMGFFALPKKGAGVWIEFEHGDPDYPIWVGCWWGTSSELPTETMQQPDKRVVLKTAAGHSIVVDDSDGNGSIALQTSGGQKIVLSQNGIEIDDGNGGKLQVSGGRINANNGALEVM